MTQIAVLLFSSQGPQTELGATLSRKINVMLVSYINIRPKKLLQQC